MNWTVMGFGRHRGLTLPEVVFRDPDRFFWACEDGVFRGPLVTEAAFVNERARKIRIPQPGGEPLVAEYAISRRTGDFAGLELVPASRDPHDGSTPTCRKTVIDLGFLRSVSDYDKCGGRLIVRQAKYYLFGDESYRMTRERAAAFFDDDRNFDLG
jgi:hypothetical protein